MGCTCVDPLQSIFDFEQGQKAVDWPADVYPVFEKVGELTTPWRWKKAGNRPLAEWLERVRAKLKAGHEIDLRGRPACVKWKQLPADKGVAKGVTIGACKQAIGAAGKDDSVVVIADPVNLSSRADLAKSLAAVGFSNIEPLTCATLYKAAKEFDEKVGFARLEATLDFLERCMTGCKKTAFLDAVKSRQSGGKAETKEFRDLIGLGVAVVEGGGSDAVLRLMEGFREREVTRAYRREMLFAMRSALKIKITRPTLDLSDAVWEVQNRIRHAGRLVSRRSVGSTLLVKGLEFDHAVVVHTAKMNRNDWYVALTRATKSMTILTPSERFAAAT